MGNLQGEAAGTRKTEPGEPRWGADWTLPINDNSENPSKQSLIREVCFDDQGDRLMIVGWSNVYFIIGMCNVCMLRRLPAPLRPWSQNYVRWAARKTPTPLLQLKTLYADKEYQSTRTNYCMSSHNKYGIAVNQSRLCMRSYKHLMFELIQNFSLVD